MAIKIKKNGKIEQFTLHSTDVKVLDLEGKFKKKDLESVIREISDTEHIHIGEVDTTKDGIWINDGEILDSSESNGVVERLKAFVNETIGELGSLTTSIKSNLVGAINELKGNVDQLSGTNLLINGDFQVWQRGTSFSNIAINTWVYTADRWRVLSQKAGVNVSKITNGISISSPNTAGLIALSHVYEVPSYLLGKTITISFDIKSSIDYVSTFYAFNGKSYTDIIYNKNHTITTEKQRFQFTFTLPLKMTDNMLHFWIGRAPDIGVTVEISNVKLELGSQATTFVPRPFAEELALCQRYYQRYWRDETYKNSKMMIGMCHEVIANGYTKANFFLPVEMRVAPTVKIVGSPLQLRQSSHGGAVGGTTTFEIEPTTLNLLSIKAINAGITANTLYAIGTWATGKSNYLEADAEIY